MLHSKEEVPRHLPLHKILHDTPALENPHLLPITERIRDCRDTSVRVDLEELRGFLVILAELDFGRFIRETSRTEKGLAEVVDGRVGRELTLAPRA